ncbi:DUF6188 family protein [Nocardia sp. NPDC024068]|uniref:DUF6188 family protein n=1 Tax=Nocardia sp. NPDC024068 TaxID=3157197 RepID=UPI0033FE636D
MSKVIREYEDRWVLPLRGTHVTDIAVRGGNLTLRVDSGIEIRVGMDAELTPGSIARKDGQLRPLEEMDFELVQQALASEILSCVVGKSGALRIVFRSGWKLVVASDRGGAGTSIVEGTIPLWTRGGGLSSALGYPVRDMNEGRPAGDD